MIQYLKHKELTIKGLPDETLPGLSRCFSYTAVVILSPFNPLSLFIIDTE